MRKTIKQLAITSCFIIFSQQQPKRKFTIILLLQTNCLNKLHCEGLLLFICFIFIFYRSIIQIFVIQFCRSVCLSDCFIFLYFFLHSLLTSLKLNRIIFSYNLSSS
ncbi:transmembrane protein, putative (macronuclear) [Tetrahymena thermophila SB210]|uniref:Transmembrane protein, putative n=1 Tax=Tetrahymena thermophila (strain SB210) TaxID=312017 RepID=W7XDS0_TETTS|nr:transmembrane protein, putative [Tetrahymena thermophila SB210]EWS70929.1 transmembrane protein, putative [Tetrahymena thermophila SB210]|eukprot:XP_012656544.1 transmembrane protein, putative [Tetrahymena thermophila SB210]